MKEKSFKKILALSLSILLILPTFSFAAMEDWGNFFAVKELIEEGYFEKVDEELLLDGATKGLFYYLDEYSEFYTEEEFKELTASVKGSKIGVGLYLTVEDDKIVVLAPVENGAAERAGIKSGDILVSIDGKEAKGMDLERATELLIGDEESYTTIVVNRRGRNLPFRVQRETITMEAVYYEIRDGIGYIDIEQFVEGVGSEVKRALEHFESNNVDKVILDLRDNPGGYLKEALEIANLIIPKGPVVKLKYRKSEKLHQSTASFTKPKYKMVVLANENSASASEVLLGAIKDREVGTIVGNQTYGKAKVQELIKMEKGGVKITVAEYFTPKGVNISGRGITPHIIVKDLDGEGDAQMDKALEILRK